MQPFPGPGPKWQVSTAGGTEPFWARDGKELFYRSGDAFLALQVTTEPTFRAGKPRILFRGRFQTGGRAEYDVTPDGRRFVFLEEDDLAGSTELHVLLGGISKTSAAISSSRSSGIR